ncbi:hypothetical protein [[Clostridium] colinum]|uniref:hypothetical protein n=1 Tax=[Clostridium] colinum TaxID=36835 RepID=UPI0020248258|nr:hypothetical protein [[Clostridium] colinum]
MEGSSTTTVNTNVLNETRGTTVILGTSGVSRLPGLEGENSDSSSTTIATNSTSSVNSSTSGQITTLSSFSGEREQVNNSFCGTTLDFYNWEDYFDECGRPITFAGDTVGLPGLSGEKKKQTVYLLLQVFMKMRKMIIMKHVLQ